MIEPIFILANPRSGSSVFRLVLNNSEYSVFPPECGFIQWLYPKYKDWNSNKITDFVKDVLKSKKIEGWNLKYEPLLNYITLFNPKTYSYACYLIYKYYGELSGKNIRVWGDKNNYYIHHLDTLSEIYPNAKYIWLKRNSKDICASYLRLDELDSNTLYKPNVSNDISEIFDEINNNTIKIDNFLNKINKSNKISIEFEKFILSDSTELNKIAMFTGIDIRTNIDNFNKKLYFDEPEITMKWKGKTKQKLDSSHINTYKSHPLSDEIDILYNLVKW